jgi:nicotinamide riboside kinase
MSAAKTVTVGSTAVEEERRRQHWAAENDAALARLEAEWVQVKERKADHRHSVSMQRREEHVNSKPEGSV